MQKTESIYERDRKTIRQAGPGLRHFLKVYVVLLVVVLIALVLPLVNVNRFQRRIVRSLSESLGRPIHLDRISLTLLPLPGLTIENLVVGEDPAFGAEPFVRASQVRATLRVSSLWRRRIEFTRISFTEPSINLVRSSHDRWNLESILLQAARIDAAPTGQARPSAAPRFPYIEATGARLNLKLDREKMPFSLTETELALWLHSPQEWQLRLESRPVRTDTSVSETGIFQMEGTLGRASALNDVPIDLKGVWRNVPLGEASHMVVGHDAGVRGSMTLSASARGTIQQSALQTVLHLSDVRRADFVPAQTLSLDLECQAVEAGRFESLSDVRCSWPPALDPGKKVLALAGAVPHLREKASASFELGTPGIQADELLRWARIASDRISPNVSVTGLLTGSATFRETPGQAMPWKGQFVLTDGSVTIPSVAPTPLFKGEIMVRPATEKDSQPARFLLSPVPLTLGGRDFATLEGSFDATGYTLHLTGTATPQKLLALGAAIPQLGDGLEEALSAEHTDSPTRIDLTSSQAWTATRTWRPTEHTATPPAKHRFKH